MRLDLFVEKNESVDGLSPLIKKSILMAKNALAGSSVREERTRKEEQSTDVPQMDLFVANLLDYKLKDDIATMEAPIFSLSTKPDMDKWRWTSQDKKKWIEIMPSSIGRATIHDKDLLIYLTSQLIAAMNSAARAGTKIPGRKMRFTMHDFMRATGRDTGGKSGRDTGEKSNGNVEKTLDRLSGTRLKTNINIGALDHRSNFGLIETYNYILRKDAKGNERMESIEITLSEWLYSALEQKNILTISPQYFTLRKPLEKRLYELACKHVGDQADWKIKEYNLLEKAGSKGTISEFRRMLIAIIKDDRIPDYRMARHESDNGENMVRFYQKSAKKLALAYAKKKI